MEGEAAKLIVADPDDRLVAAVLAMGLRLGVSSLSAVSRWADEQILKLPEAPPSWLIDLSLASETLHVLDAIRSLKVQSEGVDREAVFRTFCSSLLDLQNLSPVECQRVADNLYDIACACFDGDWTCPLLRAADEAADEFMWRSDGQYQYDNEAAAEQFRQFVDGLRDERLQRAASFVSLKV